MEFCPGYETASGDRVAGDGLVSDRWGRARVRLFYRLLRRRVPGLLVETMPRAFWPPEELAAYQRGRLAALLGHARREVPYYRELPSWPADLSGASAEEMLSILPPVSRAVLRQDWERLLADSFRSRKLIRESSGGSTGEPVAHHIGLEEHTLKGARERRSFALQGVPLGARLLRIWGARADVNRRGGTLRQYADRALRSQIWFDSYRLGEERVAECIRLIRRWKPAGIFGYAMGVQEVARAILARGVSVPSPRAVITSAERLDDGARECIGKAFGCPVLDNYGCRETGVIAWECREKGGLHIDADEVLVEILREGQPVPPGEDGMVAVTALESYAMPLIRYTNGDVGRLIPGRCACGLTLPRMDLSVGRSVELLATPDGRAVHGLVLAPHSVQYPGVKQMQVEQVAVDHLIIRVVGDLASARPHLERELVGKVHKLMGKEVKVEFRQETSIPVSPSGKRVYILSRVAPTLRQGGRIEV